MTQRERILYMIQKLGLQHKQIASDLGYSRDQSISDLLSKEKTPTKFVISFANFYKINREWLETGEGNPSEPEDPLPADKDDYLNKYIRLLEENRKESREMMNQVMRITENFTENLKSLAFNLNGLRDDTHAGLIRLKIIQELQIRHRAESENRPDNEIRDEVAEIAALAEKEP